MILKFASLFLFCILNFSSAAQIAVRNSGIPYYLAINVDEVPPQPSMVQIPDDEVKAINIGIQFQGAPGGTVFYSFIKCGVVIFNSTTSIPANFNLNFDNEWINLFLNGTTNECVEKHTNRELIVLLTSTGQFDGSLTFEKSILERNSQRFGYPTVVNINFDGTRKRMAPLEGILRIQDDHSQYFPISIMSDSEQSLEIGVCNSTFLRIEEAQPFHRQFTERELRILSLMKHVTCESWRNDLHHSNFFIKSLTGTGNLRIEANLKGTTNLLDDVEGIAKTINI